MNLHFQDEKMFKTLVNSSLIRVRVGSYMYGMESENSDTDYLYIYLKPKSLSSSFLWEHHQLQFKKDGVDHNFTDLHSFIRNIMTGDSTINFEVLHSYEFKNHELLNFLYENRKWFYSYNIARSYLGLARRDLKYIGKSKGYDYKRLHHAMRGYHAAHDIIHERNYINNLSLSNPRLYETLKEVKNGLCKKHPEEIVDLYGTWIDFVRKGLGKDLESGKINRVMNIDDMKKLDSWLDNVVSYIGYSNIHINQEYFYKALEEGVKYD